MPDLIRVEARIFGSEYTITGEADAEYILAITRYLDSKMKELAEIYPNANPLKLAVLAGINITDELFQERQNPTMDAINEENLDIVNEYESRTRKMISLIDEGLSGNQ
ncbi:MAG: cell division protein ZapA [Leptospiraceae bacterium]|nr:cell division protein ZapA [Leptospiraceae bacterium]